MQHSVFSSSERAVAYCRFPAHRPNLKQLEPNKESTSNQCFTMVCISKLEIALKVGVCKVYNAHRVTDPENTQMHDYQ